MGFLSNNVTPPGHKQTAAFFKVSNKEVQISSLIQIIFYFLLQHNILQSLSLSSQHCSNLNKKPENSVNISLDKV